MGELSLHILSCGMLDVDRSVISPGDDSRKRVLLPITAILIESEGRRILVDTGMMPDVAGNSSTLHDQYDVEPQWVRAIVSPEQRIDRQLQRYGLAPSDLDLVINTHFHMDHAGGNVLFPGIPIAAQEEEFIAAREPETYLSIWDAPGLQFRSERGDWSPLPGVEMLWTPGHTPGHQSMLVRLEPQPWLFTLDSVYTEEQWRTGKLGAAVHVGAARSSIERLRTIASQENARLIFGHDVGQWESLRPFG